MKSNTTNSSPQYTVMDTSYINAPNYSAIENIPLIFISTVILELEAKAKSDDYTIACKAKRLLDLALEEQNVVLSAVEDAWLEGWSRNNDSKIIASVRHYIRNENYNIIVYTYDKVMALQCKDLNVQVPYRYFKCKQEKETDEKPKRIYLLLSRSSTDTEFYVDSNTKERGRIYFFENGKVISNNVIRISNQDILYYVIGNNIQVLKVIDASKGIAQIVKQTTFDGRYGLMKNIKRLAV